MLRAPLRADPDAIPGRMVDLGERGQTFVRDSGPAGGPTPVVLLHGWSLTADGNFGAIYPMLSQTRRIISLDVRCHGRGIRRAEGFRLSEATDDVIAVMDALGLDSAILCGYSMGGGIAADAASRYPDRVSGTVITGSSACYMTTFRDRVVWKICKLLTVLPRFGINGNPSALAAQLLRRVSRGATEYWTWLGEELSATTLTDVLTAADAVPNVDLRPQLRRAEPRPNEMILTARDRICRPFLQAELAGLLDSHVVEVSAGHHLPLTDPGRFGNLLLDALSRLDSRLSDDSASSRTA